MPSFSIPSLIFVTLFANAILPFCLIYNNNISIFSLAKVFINSILFFKVIGYYIFFSPILRNINNLLYNIVNKLLLGVSI